MEQPNTQQPSSKSKPKSKPAAAAGGKQTGGKQTPLTLEAFLKQYAYKKDNANQQTITHTRIGDKKDIYGGAYCIPPDKMDDFYRLYHTKVFKNKKMEYLTEKQGPGEGPVLVDFDFRYNIDVEDRKHNQGHIVDIVDLYLNKLKTILDITGTEFPIYIFEKPNVNKLPQENLTKDGIHMIIGVHLDHPTQLYLRKLVLEEIGNVWDELPIINSWESVLDEGISAGYTNWQLYGSRKPYHESYRLSYLYKVQMDMDDADHEFNFSQTDIKTFDVMKNMAQISAQYQGHVRFATKESIKAKVAALGNKTKQKKSGGGGGGAGKKTLKLLGGYELVEWSKISNVKQLDAALEAMLSNIEGNEYYIKEAHEYVMILPKQYYGDGSYDRWIRVGWALRNTDERLFLSWIKMSAQSEKFDYGDVGEFYERWKGFELSADGLTYKSVLYWAKNDAYAEYVKIRQNTVDYFIQETIKHNTEFDLATVLYQMFKERFICVSIKNNFWYEFKNHRWHEIDSGTTLRLAISKDMYQQYNKIITEEYDKMDSLAEDDPQREKIQKKCHVLAGIGTMLKTTSFKNNIMREARELFYDKEFLQQQDENNLLLCFKNGVMDFDENRFRPGRPDDYITKCTNIDYVPIEKVDKKKLREVEEFVAQLFPVQELRNYMWQHLASTLIGANENQTFNIYTGSGANGKSKLVDLMTAVLGDYKGTVPITLITQKRIGIGNTSSEIVQLRGTRYAVMQEPSKGDVINEGILKEITGGDPIQGRALFKETVTFVPQFKLVVCTNTLFEIKDTGDGTWRRIRVCDFMSKFKENPVKGDPDLPYQFPIDKKINVKFETWKGPFIAKLVDLAKKNKGIVNDCQMVLVKSNAYREDQDYLSEFLKEKVEACDDGKIKKTELYETFKQWYALQYGRGVPKGKELYELMDKRYGKYKGCWKGVAIIYETEDDDVEDI
jgi:P4 family phage/plasmid primase-like protien